MDGMNNQNFDGQVENTQTTDERKSKLVGGLLGIFLGSLGIHNFYLGYTKKAIIQVAVTTGSIVLGIILYVAAVILSFVYIGILIYPLATIVCFVPSGIAIWGFVEGIMILAGGIKTDGRGIPLKE